VSASGGFRKSSDDPIVAEFTNEVEGTYDLCNSGDQALLTEASRMALADAIAQCGKMKTTRVLGWVLGVAGAAILGTGAALTAMNAGGDKAAAARARSGPAIDVVWLPGGVAANVRLSF